jgi:hypothetical protein
VNTLGNLAQECSSNLLIRGIFGEVNGNEKLLSLLIDITNVDTTLVGEEDPITLSGNVSGQVRSGHDWRDRRSAAEKSRNTTA